jgi:hypothetical protein
MSKIIDIIPGLREQGGTYGVEVEVGGTNLPLNVPGWHITRDGSIKGSNESLEYVFKSPYSFKKSLEIIDILYNYFERFDTVVDDNDTAGVHVHVNMQNYTINQLFTFIVIYHILEIPLLKFCGDHRSGNHFCLRAVDAEAIIDLYYDILNTRNFKHLNDNYRYASINLVSLKKFGSIELRGMRTSRDRNDLKNWLLIIDRIATSAKKYKDPLEVMIAISGDSYINFAKHILQEDFMFIANQDNLEENIKTGLRLIQPIANSDWTERVNSNPFVKVDW